MNNKASRQEQRFPLSIKRGSVEIKIYRTVKLGSEYFVVNFYHDGKRQRRTFSDFDRAKTEADTVARRLASSDSAVLTLSGADLSAYQRARQVLDPLGVAIEIAATEYADAKRKLADASLSQAVEFFLKRHPKKIEPHSIQSVVKEFILAKQSEGLSERYIKSLRWALPKFTAAFHCNIGDVTAPEITKWLRQLKVSPRTQNNLRNSVQTLFSYAKAQRYLAKDNDEIADVPIIKDRGGEIEIFTPLELEEILARAGDKLISFVALGAFAGVRHAEIQRLDWQDIRFDDGIIEIRASKAKTASRRIVPILSNLRQWLLPLKQDFGLVCPYLNAAFELHLITKRINEARRAAWALENGISGFQLSVGSSPFSQPSSLANLRMFPSATMSKLAVRLLTPLSPAVRWTT
ncbi:MAG TPA: hypothetical protein VGY98_20435 [Verrucomicrobiae bacterium]|nr:hypothetical protein [Verrucomicrobiae bacterium]